MTDTDGLAHWSAAYGRFLTRAAARSTRTLDLWYLALQRVSRGEVDAPTLQRAWVDTFGAPDAGHLSALTASHAQFAAGLVQAAAGAPEPPPAYDAADPAAWFHRLVRYAAEADRRRVQAFEAASVAPTAGPPGEAQAAGAARASAQLAAVARLYFDLLDGLGEMSSRLEARYLRAVLGAGRAMDETVAAVHLRGRAGAVASSSLGVENTRAEPADVRCEIADVRRADGIGPAFRPAIAVEPPAVRLQPRQEATVRLSLLLDREAYEPDALYVGAIRVVHAGGTAVDVPLRITATGAGSSSAGGL
jgi:hypothetical protein